MTSDVQQNPISPWPHRWAIVLCCATFPLIWVGALVTTYDAGMAFPDWPTSQGYNLFLYPWQVWLTGPFDMFVEHGHRLLGALAGLLTIGLVIAAHVSGATRQVRLLAWLALVGVIAQGVLGGARVLLDERLLALVHGCTGPAFFAFACVIALVTSRRWQATADSPPLPRAAFIACLGTAVLAYVQLVFGAMLRHVPVDAGPSWFRLAVLFHIVTAIVLALHVLFSSFKLLRTVNNPWLTRPMTALVLLVGAQLVLGVSTWVMKYSWPAALGEFTFAASYTVTANALVPSLVTTAHVAVGSLILATSVVLACRAGRLAKWRLEKVPFDFAAGLTA